MCLCAQELGFKVHHRLHVVMSALPFFARNVMGLRAWATGVALDGASAAASVASGTCATRLAMMGEVTGAAFFPVFLYLHPTRSGASMLLLLNYLCEKVFVSARSVDDAVAVLIMVFVGTGIGHVLEVQMRNMHRAQLAVAAAAEDGRRADSCLNHLLKNKAAEAGYLIESVTDKLRELERDGEKKVVASLLDELAKVQGIHEQTVDWTYMRELFVQLQRGIYQTATPPTELPRLLRRVMGSAECTLELLPPCPAVLHFDAAVLKLMLEEARSNALKYREPSTPLLVTASLEQSSADAPPYLHVGLDNCNRTVPSL